MIPTRLTRNLRGRRGRALLALAATALAGTALASPVSAAPATGDTAIRLAEHDRGRTLSGQGVRVVAKGAATESGSILTLPIAAVESGNPASATPPADSWLRFERGGRGVALTDLELDLSKGQLTGKLAGKQMAVFWLGADPVVDSATGTLRMQAGDLVLIRAAANLLGDRLDLDRSLRGDGVGMVWLAAQAAPTPAPAPPAPSTAKTVTAGSLDWGVLSSWRSYVLGNFGPGSAGTIATAGGASTVGEPAEASSYFRFPASGGSLETAGEETRLRLQTAGSVKFEKPGHCIVEVDFSALALHLDGAASSLTLDSVYDIDTPAPPSCTDNPTVETDGVAFAAVDASAPPVVAGGKFTWTALPATLTASGAAAWGAGYEAGEALDPITVSVDTE
jgi:hypothetical protein